LLCADLERLVVFLLMAFGAGRFPDKAAKGDKAPGFGCQRAQRRLSSRIGEHFRAQALVRIGRVPVWPQDKVELGQLAFDLFAGQHGREFIRAFHVLQDRRDLVPAQIEVFQRRQGRIRQAFARFLHRAVRRRSDIGAEGGVCTAIGRGR
tara:strand:+ start:3581 stop:4030 length:450 start_codon:yes stop_codon:yes gene_type:complete